MHAAVCGSLPHPANGRVELDGTDVGSIATYYCDDLFELVGDDTRVCREDGTYSGAEPVCERKYLVRNCFIQEVKNVATKAEVAYPGREGCRVLLCIICGLLA